MNALTSFILSLIVYVGGGFAVVYFTGEQPSAKADGF
jgi:hypothetical protein